MVIRSGHDRFFYIVFGTLPFSVAFPTQDQVSPYLLQNHKSSHNIPHHQPPSRTTKQSTPSTIFTLGHSQEFYLRPNRTLSTTRPWASLLRFFSPAVLTMRKGVRLAWDPRVESVGLRVVSEWNAIVHALLFSHCELCKCYNHCLAYIRPYPSHLHL